ncbi:hypothetical protein [Henriciella aquimarina]|uniref:hypothetical protein n=1 Tax=Henriciella aquimarina TaxID=545261 RepID=UPI0009FC08A7|nr:hypothetical protein [Henriciella aquimarina]
MSFNLTLATTQFVICVTDRRLSRPRGGIVSERSNKLTAFQCVDAHGFVTYNGIGLDPNGQTPSDWLADIDGLAGLPLDQFAAAIKTDADKRLNRLSSRGVDVRHTFVVAGFAGLDPFVMLISNYESLKADGHRMSARPALQIEQVRISTPITANVPYCLIATGAQPKSKKAIRERVIDKVKAGKPAKEIRGQMVKVVRDVAYQGDRKGSVGTSVHSGIVGLAPEFEINGHVPGGTTVLEAANYISPGFMAKDMWIDVGSDSGEPRWRYNPATRTAAISEKPCSNCRAPVPEGYARCGVCDTPTRPSREKRR